RHPPPRPAADAAEGVAGHPGGGGVGGELHHRATEDTEEGKRQGAKGKGDRVGFFTLALLPFTFDLHGGRWDAGVRQNLSKSSAGGPGGAVGAASWAAGEQAEYNDGTQ